MLPLSYTLAVDGASLDVREMRPGDVSSPECVAVVSHREWWRGKWRPLHGCQVSGGMWRVAVVRQC